MSGHPSEELDLRAGFFALFFLLVCLASVFSMLWVPPVIAFTIVVIAFTVFVTTAMMSAKTTSGYTG